MPIREGISDSFSDYRDLAVWASGHVCDACVWIMAGRPPDTIRMWFVTPHAVRRYIERVDRTASYEAALAELVRFSEVARPIKEITPGVWLYRGGKPLRLRFRVAMAEQKADGSPGLPQLLTVMAGHDRAYSQR